MIVISELWSYIKGKEPPTLFQLVEAATEDEVADGHAHDGGDEDDLPWQPRDDDDCQERRDEEEDGNDDAGYVEVQAGARVLEDGVAVEDHDVEASEVHDEVHSDGDEEGLENGRLQEVVDGDLVLQRLLNLPLDLINLPGGENSWLFILAGQTCQWLDTGLPLTIAMLPALPHPWKMTVKTSFNIT